MSCVQYIADLFNFQQFHCEKFKFSDDYSTLTLFFESKAATKSIFCPECNGKVHVYDNGNVILKDIPMNPDYFQEVSVNVHRYRCTCCGKSFTEDIGFKHKGSLVTERAAMWIKSLSKLHLTIKDISLLTGIHWNTISKIQKEYMDEQLEKRSNELKSKGYKPKRLAVDEFAIHKGHTYATCVMDLDEGDVIWVGKGRAIEDFRKFFEDIDIDYLSEVEAFAMDMNASYNKLVEEYLPNASIVYDRYHMQAQFGKDVLGSVRLEEAKYHQEKAKELDAKRTESTDIQERKQLKQEAKKERSEYSKIKGSRWDLLTREDNLSESSKNNIEEILGNHEILAICYAMREEMCNLFECHDTQIAEQRWEKWFEACKESNIPQLVKFAELKEKRIPGLANHAKYPISTGKLEGFNNKIKVAKRIGYGYRNDEYFFTLVKFLSLPKPKSQSPRFL